MRMRFTAWSSNMLTSKNNPKIKSAKKLLSRRGREKAGQYLIEGPHLLEAALEAGADLAEVFLTLEHEADFKLANQTLISPEIAAELSDTQRDQGVFAVVNQDQKASFQPVSPAVLLLDGIQDPGNLGTLIRSADAFNYQDIYLGKGTVDPYSPKVVRSMQGSQFHVRLHQVVLEEAMASLRAAGYCLAATELNDQAQALETYNLKKHQKWGIILGNEGNGVRPEIIAASDISLYITMLGQAESLNVAIAGSIAMHHFLPNWSVGSTKERTWTYWQKLITLGKMTVTIWP